MFRSSGEANFDKLLEKATSHLLLEVDLGAVLGITDLIRQKDCTPKYAVAAIKKKLATPNPHVAFYSLQVLEAVVKNCGSPSHEEVATKEFMEYLRELAKTTNHDNVRDKILELIQTWAHAFRKLSSYRAVQDCVNIMKAEGCKFPPLVEADAMFTSDTAPEWQEGECCNRCRVQFGILNRKHHCRACGQIFCAKCSSKVSTVPKFGIEKEVRVCDSCFEKYGKHKPTKSEKVKVSTNFSSLESDDAALQAAIEASLAEFSSKKAQHSQVQQPRGKTEAELKEEEDLALALAISQSEAEEKEREKQRKSSSVGGVVNSATSTPNTDRELEKTTPEKEKSSTPKKSALAKSTFEQEDPELARYLDRNYWEQRHGQTKEEISREETGSNLHNKSPSPFQPSAPVKENKNKVEQVEEMDGFMESLRASIEMFVNRMRSNSNRGRHVSNDSTVQSLFLNITSLHSQLLNYIKAQDDWRAHYESLQEKLMQVHDARDALDDLRKDYSDKQRRIAEEVERQRQIQRAIKLQDMRQQKHQYLQQQRELALRRVQDEERQMQLRMEQQRLGTYGGYPMRGQGYMVPPPGQMPQGMMMGPPPPQGQGQDPQQMHHYMPPQHYVPGQQSNTNMMNMLPQHMQTAQQVYSNPYMGQGPPSGNQLPGGHVPQQQQMYIPTSMTNSSHPDPMQQHIPGQPGQGPPQQPQQMGPMSQGQAQIPAHAQSYMQSQSQNFYQPPQQQHQMVTPGAQPPQQQHQMVTPGAQPPQQIVAGPGAPQLPPQHQQMMGPGGLQQLPPQQQPQTGGQPQLPQAVGPNPPQQLPQLPTGSGPSPLQQMPGINGPQQQQLPTSPSFTQPPSSAPSQELGSEATVPVEKNEPSVAELISFD